MSRLKLFVATVGACLLMAATASAQGVVDPSDLFVNAGTAYISPPGFTNELHAITFPTSTSTLSNTVTLTLNGQAASTTTTPVYLILGLPNVTAHNFFGSTVPIANLTAVSNSGVSTPVFGSFPANDTTWGVAGVSAVSTASQTTGYFTQLNPGQDVYKDLFNINGGGNASQSFTNWQSVESSVNNITADTFALYAIDFTQPTGFIGGKGEISFQLSSSLPLGTFVIGLADTKPFTTPFTETGLTTNSGTGTTTTGSAGGGLSGVPVPPSAVLFGIGALGVILGLSRRRKVMAY
jgi:hypothetical protein